MKSIFLAAVAAFLGSFFLSNSANAYDVDTHFYSTYAMARHACIKHNVALKIAATTQWMDESFISDPTSLMLLLFDGLHKRRLLHFPAPRAGNKISVAEQREILGFDTFLVQNSKYIEYAVSYLAKKEDYEKLGGLLYWTETGPNDRMASQLLMEGMKEGNLMKASASLHVIEDSFAHGGTPAEQGHAVFWHWPDRPYYNVPKYKEMSNAVFNALIAIRGLLPPEALDKNLKTFSSRPNCDLDADTLTNYYFDDVKNIVGINMLYDKEYVEQSLRWFIGRAIDVAYLIAPTAKIDKLVEEVHIDGTFDTYEALKRLVKILVMGQIEPEHGVLAWKDILDDMQLMRRDSKMSFSAFIAQFGTAPVGVFNIHSQNLDKFTDVVVRNLLRFNIPQGITKDDHWMEAENDTKAKNKTDRLRPRFIEMRLREKNMQAYVERAFGEKIKFEESNSSTEAGFGHEIRKEAEAFPPKFDDDGYQHVTFNIDEKNQFDHMIFEYLYPTTAKDGLNRITAIVHRIRMTEDPVAKGALRAWAIKQLWSDIPTVIHDLIAEHSGPSEDNWFYRNPFQYKEYEDEKVFKPLLGPQDAWNLENLVGSLEDTHRG